VRVLKRASGWVSSVFLRLRLRADARVPRSRRRAGVQQQLRPCLKEMTMKLLTEDQEREMRANGTENAKRAASVRGEV